MRYIGGSSSINISKIQHKILGDESIDTICKNFNREKSKINIKFYGNEYNKLDKQINAITVPHAGFIYSGFFGLFAIDELIKFSKSNKITILWFLHNKQSHIEHSLQNVKELFKCNNPKITIENILIEDTTTFDSIKSKLKQPFIVSTDFSHHNNNNSSNNINDVWINDKQIFENKETVDVSIKPCGKEPLRIFKKYCLANSIDINLIGYSNSINKDKWWITNTDTFDGVSYAALAAYKNTWYNNLYSNMLAYPHLLWTNNVLLENITLIDIKNGCKPTQCGLFWSILHKLKGSCFVTINDKDNKTYSCFGAWEPNNNNLFSSLCNAINSVQTKSWHNNNTVTKNTLETNLNNEYILDITLIEPIEYWEPVQMPIDNIKNFPNLKNKGYVYYDKSANNVGMTYLPSVWESISNPTDFFSGLKIKHFGSTSVTANWDIYSYNSICWTFRNSND